MKNLDFEWLTDEFMLYCRTTQLREKSMMAYEQSLKLFQRRCMDEMAFLQLIKLQRMLSADTSSSSRSVENTLCLDCAEQMVLAFCLTSF